MKFIVQINGRDFLFSSEQLDTFTAMLDGMEYIDSKYKRNDKGESYYEKSLATDDDYRLNAAVLTEAAYNKLKFFSAMQDKED